MTLEEQIAKVDSAKLAHAQDEGARAFAGGVPFDRFASTGWREGWLIAEQETRRHRA